ncbi:transcriptional regulator protein [Micromonospora sp. LOL_024]|uniref:transcriptional regulator protein n=1 Tax=Micromonospora sp. LOL_024 TaxID=3345412 RepID=UPI003A8ABE5C
MVHRTTRRVLDGMHRVRAAMQRGEDTIAVEYFDGDEAAGFVAAVQANVMHGLPLSLADREAAAAKLVNMLPQRSDRWIASVTGLAARTVAAVRARGGAVNAGAGARIGRDGRVRPLNTAEARREASNVILERPEASLREVARIVGLSPATVRDVRERMRRGIDPVPELQRAGEDLNPVTGPRGERPVLWGVRRGGRDVQTLLEILKGDPALRFSETGRSLLRWLSSQAEGAAAWRKVVNGVPPHCAYVVAELAAGCADEWSAFAADLAQQLDDIA